MAELIRAAIFLAVILAVIGALLLAATKLGLLKAPAEREEPYRKREYLLSKAEMMFYRTLLVAIGDRWVVMAKVRLADLIQVDRSKVAEKDGEGAGKRSGWQSAFNRIQAKHVDFVLCDAAMRPVVVIELDDSSHDEEDAQDRDGFKDRAMKAAGLPMMRVRAAGKYVPRELVKGIEEAVGGGGVGGG